MILQSACTNANVAACRAGENSCDRDQLTTLETIALDVAVHQMNVSNCMDGIGPCDHFDLTIRESRAVALAEHQQNISRCKDGRQPCDISTLSKQEMSDLEVFEKVHAGASRLSMMRTAAMSIMISNVCTAYS
jgi:hypothetical protein